MTDLMTWLEPKLVDAPESLRTRILDALTSGPVPSSPLPAVLREVGERLMQEAKSAPPTRGTAMTLLAADALITFACEAVAESEPEKLAEMR